MHNHIASHRLASEGGWNIQGDDMHLKWEIDEAGAVTLFA